MPRKIEDWSKDVYQGNENNLIKYRELTGRELAIVAAATIDIGLAHLIEKRLINNKKEVEEFLGLNGDGRAPSGSFGARIQLAYLLGLIDKNEVIAFRSIKMIRNYFAHRIDVYYLSKNIQKELIKIVNNFDLNILKLSFGTNITKELLIERVKEKESFAETILLISMLLYQILIDKRLDSTESIKKFVD